MLERLHSVLPVHSCNPCVCLLGPSGGVRGLTPIVMHRKKGNQHMLTQKNENLLVFSLASGAIIYNKVTKKSCKLGTAEYALFKQIDGHKTIHELSGQTNYDILSVQELLKVFESYGLLAHSELTIDKQQKKKHTLLYEASFLDIFTRPILKSFFNILIILSFPALVCAVVLMQGKIDVEAMIQSTNIFHIIAMDVILAISVSLHELSHAISAKINGAFCAEIGYKFDFLVPLAYTTLCGVHEIKSRKRKIQVFYSGIAVNALIATISLLIMNIHYFQDSLIVFLVFSCNICLILINSITLIKSDVYYILCCLFGDKNLKEETQKMLRKKGCISIGYMVYFMLTYIVEPLVIVVLLIIAFGKIGGKLL